MKTVFVIGIGNVVPSTGKTKFDWNLYESQGLTMNIWLASNRLLLSAGDDFEIGERVVIRDNDSNRKLNELTIQDVCKSDRESVLEMLLRNKYDYYPTRPFKKKRFPSKLNTSYSVKGIV